MVSTRRRATAMRPLSASEVAAIFGGAKPKTGNAEKPTYLTLTLRDVLISGYGPG